MTPKPTKNQILAELIHARLSGDPLPSWVMPAKRQLNTCARRWIDGYMASAFPQESLREFVAKHRTWTVDDAYVAANQDMNDLAAKVASDRVAKVASNPRPKISDELLHQPTPFRVDSVLAPTPWWGQFFRRSLK